MLTLRLFKWTDCYGAVGVEAPHHGQRNCSNHEKLRVMIARGVSSGEPLIYDRVVIRKLWRISFRAVMQWVLSSRELFLTQGGLKNVDCWDTKCWMFPQHFVILRLWNALSFHRITQLMTKKTTKLNQLTCLDNISLTYKRRCSEYVSQLSIIIVRLMKINPIRQPRYSPTPFHPRPFSMTLPFRPQLTPFFCL